MIRPILVPNANCLPDPATFVNTQIAGISKDAYYPTGRAFFDVAYLTKDENTDPYTAVMSGNPVMHVNNAYSGKVITEFYNSEFSDVPFTKVFPVCALDLSTNTLYILVLTGGEATWGEFGTIENQAYLEGALTELGILFDHSIPHPIFR